MRARRAFGSVAVLLLVSAPARAQWNDPRLLAGQVGFHVAASFLGKVLVKGERPGRALREALADGAAAGLVAHAGYSVAGRAPDWALPGKLLAQKANLITHRSIEGRPVFDASLYRDWQLTHSFVHFRWDGRPHLELDAVNAAFGAYHLASPRYDLEWRRTLTSGSLVFRNAEPPPGIRGFYAPGVIWLAPSSSADSTVLAHEIVHSLQAERGAAIAEGRVRWLRLNYLVLASGVPALLAGWPEHDLRFHEREADAYAGR